MVHSWGYLHSVFSPHFKFRTEGLDCSNYVHIVDPVGVRNLSPESLGGYQIGYELLPSTDC